MRVRCCEVTTVVPAATWMLRRPVTAQAARRSYECSAWGALSSRPRARPAAPAQSGTASSPAHGPCQAPGQGPITPGGGPTGIVLDQGLPGQAPGRGPPTPPGKRPGRDTTRITTTNTTTTTTTGAGAVRVFWGTAPRWRRLHARAPPSRRSALSSSRPRGARTSFSMTPTTRMPQAQWRSCLGRAKNAQCRWLTSSHRSKLIVPQRRRVLGQSSPPGTSHSACSLCQLHTVHVQSFVNAGQVFYTA